MKKYIVLITILMFSTVADLYLSTYVHCFLSKINLSNIDFLYCIDSIKNNPQHNKLFFILLIGCVTAILAIAILSKNRSYNSELCILTDKIETPVPAGQYQYGSAKWVKEKELTNFFSKVIIDKNNAKFNDLIKKGYEDLDFYKEEKA